MNINAQKFPEVYQWLGINLNALGCVMLPLEFTPMPEEVAPYLYKSPNPERFWIDGWVADKKAHCTLLYGLLSKARQLEPHIRKVLEGWFIEVVEIEDVSYFPSPYPDENYWCIIAHIYKDKNLLEGHQRLSFLPHINTFPEYTPHMTLGYIQCSEEKRDEIIQKMNEKLKGLCIDVTGDIDLGRI